MKRSPRYLVFDINEPLKELYRALAHAERPVARWLNDWLGEEVSLDEAVKCLSVEADVQVEVSLHVHSIRLEYGERFAKATDAFCKALYRLFKGAGLYRSGRLIGAPYKWYGPFLILEMR